MHESEHPQRPGVMMRRVCDMCQAVWQVERDLLRIDEYSLKEVPLAQCVIINVIHVRFWVVSESKFKSVSTPGASLARRSTFCFGSAAVCEPETLLIVGFNEECVLTAHDGTRTTHVP